MRSDDVPQMLVDLLRETPIHDSYEIALRAQLAPVLTLWTAHLAERFERGEVPCMCGDESPCLCAVGENSRIIGELRHIAEHGLT